MNFLDRRLKVREGGKEGGREGRREGGREGVSEGGRPDKGVTTIFLRPFLFPALFSHAIIRTRTELR
jgi:hypothetical protein